MYANAREIVFALNRLVKRGARPRKGERRSHFERDRDMARAMFHDLNIVGFGVGPKISGKERRSSREICLVVFVRKKMARTRLRRGVEIPELFALNTSGVSVVTDIQEWGTRPVAHSLSPGASIGDQSGNSGTMTLAVQDNATGNPLILGCSHVLAACGSGQVGDGIESPADPGADAGSNIVGRLLRFTTIDPSSLNNAVDAAVATPIDGLALSGEIAGIGAPSGIRDLTLEGDSIVNQLAVQMNGMVTGLQSGTVRNIHVSTSITYHQLGDLGVHFVDLVQYDALSKDGDSGAAVVDSASPPSLVGMHIAGTQDGSASLFTHIRFVFDRLQIGFWNRPSDGG